MGLEDIPELLKLLQAAIVNAILDALAAVGINVPPIVIQLALVGLTLLFFWKWAKKLPWLILILLGLFLASFLVGALSNI